MFKDTNSIPKLVVVDQITYTDDNLDSPFSGTFKWVDTDHSEVESLFENGKCIYQKVFENGRLNSETILQHDKQRILIYDNNGKVSCKSVVAKGKLDGLLEIFSEEILFMTIAFINGKKNGKWMVYHVDGSILSCDYYIDDIKQS